MICRSRRRRRISRAAGREQIGVLETDASGRRLDQAQDEASQRALAGAGFAHQAKRFAGVDVERNVIDRADLAEDFGQVANFEKGHRVDANSRWLRILTDSHGSNPKKISAIFRNIGMWLSPLRRSAAATWRRQRRQQPDKLPAAEVFFQNEARQQHRDGRVERGDDHRFVEAAALAGVDEQSAGGDVEESGYRAESDGWAVEREAGRAWR